MTNNIDARTEAAATMIVARDARDAGRVMDATALFAEATGSLESAIRYLSEGRLPMVGDILVCSWGYDQTNIDYYAVEKVTAKSVRIVAISKRRIASEGTHDRVMPDPTTKIGKSMTRRFELGTGRHDVGTYRCRIESYSSARLWDGTPDRETGAAYGH